MGCKYCRIVKLDEEIVYNTKYWKAKLSDDQAFPGRCFVLSVRHVDSLSELSEKEWIDFSHIVKVLERGIGDAFGAQMFNWECLMNDAYGAKRPMPHVHWHLRPRYSKAVNISGIKFVDKEFGHRYKRRKDRIIPQKVRKEIVERIRENIS